MFGKKRKNHISGVDYTITPSNDFRLRASSVGFPTFCPMPYNHISQMDESEMLPKLDEHLNNLFKGHIDDANGDVLNGIIFSTACKGVVMLNEERANHEDLINHLVTRGIADPKDISVMKENCKKTLDDLVSEKNRIDDLITKCGEVYV